MNVEDPRAQKTVPFGLIKEAYTFREGEAIWIKTANAPVDSWNAVNLNTGEVGRFSAMSEVVLVKTKLIVVKE